MTDFLAIAISCILRGWYIFPCWPETKEPMTAHAYKDASSRMLKNYSRFHSRSC